MDDTLRLILFCVAAIFFLIGIHMRIFGTRNERADSPYWMWAGVVLGALVLAGIGGGK